MREYHVMALFRCKAKHAHRRQELVSISLQGFTPTSWGLARALVSKAQAVFQCDARFLIIDKVLL